MINNEIKYKTIQPPYTLDKWKDGSAQIRTEKEFQELVNYIPVEGGIVAREGILTLTYTPQTTDVFNPKTDSRCYLILDFEDGDNLGINVALARTPSQSIYLYPYSYPTRTGSSTWTLDAKEGSHALFITDNTAENTAAGSGPNYFGLYRPGATGNFRTWVAGGIDSTSVKEWMITGWFKITSYKTNAWLHLTGDYGTDSGIEICLITATLSMSFRTQYYNQVYGTISNLSLTASIALNRWYFWGSWCSNCSNSTATYLYDDTTGVERYTYLNGLASFTCFNVTTSMQTIGGGYGIEGIGAVTQDSEAFPGRIDYMTFWGTLPVSDSDKLSLIKQIRDLHKA